MINLIKIIGILEKFEIMHVKMYDEGYGLIYFMEIEDYCNKKTSEDGFKI